MSSVDLTTIGIRFGFAIESTAGTRPTAFENIVNPKDTPDLSPQPDSLDATSLNDLEFKRYLLGLKDASQLSYHIEGGIPLLLVYVYNAIH